MDISLLRNVQYFRHSTRVETFSLSETDLICDLRNVSLNLQREQGIQQGSLNPSLDKSDFFPTTITRERTSGKQRIVQLDYYTVQRER